MTKSYRVSLTYLVLGRKLKAVLIIGFSVLCSFYGTYRLKSTKIFNNTSVFPFLFVFECIQNNQYVYFFFSVETKVFFTTTSCLHTIRMWGTKVVSTGPWSKCLWLNNFQNERPEGKVIRSSRLCVFHSTFSFLHIFPSNIHRVTRLV